MISGMEKPAKWILMGLLLALPAGVQGQDYGFETNGNAITITKYIGAGGAVTIPEKINGMAVTSVGMSSFQSCTNLTSITIPNSVTSIDFFAFKGCTSLTNITIPKSVTDIGDMAFERCINLTSITIPTGVTYIGGQAFSSCDSLTNITIFDNVTSIENGLFSNCKNLTTITIPASVTNLGGMAFYSCPRLTSIYFKGNAPRYYVTGVPITSFPIGEDVFGGTPATIYYLPTTTGGGKTFGGRPTAVWKQ